MLSPCREGSAILPQSTQAPELPASPSIRAGAAAQAVGLFPWHSTEVPLKAASPRVTSEAPRALLLTQPPLPESKPAGVALGLVTSIL